MVALSQGWWSFYNALMVTLAMIELTKALGAEWTAVAGEVMDGGERVRRGGRA